MKKTFLLMLLLFTISASFAQNELQVQNDGKNLFLYHTVVAKENFYSIGRLFNVSPKEIAALNNLDMNKGLTIGQSIKIPLTVRNFNQKTSKGRPVYYAVNQEEGLYKVSIKNRGVLMASLRKWNNLKSDNLNPGQQLIVGYLESPEANNVVAAGTPVAGTAFSRAGASPKEEKKEAVSTETGQSEYAKPEKVAEHAKQDSPKKLETAPVRTVSNPVAVTDGTGGFFRTQFEQQIRVQPVKSDITANAGIFKTTSGWQDAKYYALLDHVEPGTIIKITNPSNNKAVYAKVLGEMSSVRQNQGYDLRISNAAASALDIADPEKFIVRVNF